MLDANAKSRLLLDERPVVLQPSLIKALGFERATVIQQVHYYLGNLRLGKVIDGERWIFNTYAEWQCDDFPFWSEYTVQKWFLRLEKDGILLSCQPDRGDWSRRKYYRIDYSKLNELINSQCSIVAEQQPSEMAEQQPSEMAEQQPSSKEQRTLSENSSEKGARGRAKTPLADDFSNPLPVGLQNLKTAIAETCGYEGEPSWQDEDEISRQALTLFNNGVTLIELARVVRENEKKIFKLNFFARDVLALRGADRRQGRVVSDRPKCKDRECQDGRVGGRVPCPKCKGNPEGCDYRTPGFGYRCSEGTVPGRIECPTCKGGRELNDNRTRRQADAVRA